jgi:ribonuclease J
MNKEVMYGSNPASSNVSSITRNNTSDKKHRFPLPKNDEILVCPIGGVAEIGMNWTLYGHNGRWVLVDAGISFSGGIASVEAIFPNPEVLDPILPLLDALIITHAHEDHIGAVHRVWPRIKCPIYATPYASEVLSERFKEAGSRGRVRMHRFDPGDTISVGPFEIDTIPLTHSTVECVGLLFKTSVGNVFHTGDWKFDPDPVLGKPTDKVRLAAIGREGVLAMVSDSTNAARTGKTTSEGSLLEGFRSVMASHRGTIVISCFASNVARVATIMKAAQMTGRYVGLVGRSMEKNERIARSLGMLDDCEAPLRFWELNHVDGYQRVILCTGTQGEASAGLSKIARGETPKFPKLAPGDVVVHSARAIPGNEHLIGDILHKCKEQGATVIQRDFNGLPLHATGHGSADEMIEMYGLIQPQFSIPVHGGPVQLADHAQLAEDCGSLPFIPKSGSVLQVTASGVKELAIVPVDLICQYSVPEGDPPEFGPWNEQIRQSIINPEPLAVAV